MREIKFRGMDVKGNWHAGNLSVLMKDIRGGAKAGSYISNPCGMPFAYEVRPETAGQFTGLHDKNGKEIYEGDVVRITAFEDDGDIFIHRIYWDDVSASFKTYGRTDGWDMTVTPESTEIIGNIHENPELLEASC